VLLTVGLGSSSRYGQQEVVNFVVEVYVHRETYRKAAVSWSYPGYHQKPDKWQVTAHEFYGMSHVHYTSLLSVSNSLRTNACK